LPRLQKLYDQYKNRSDIQLLTLNIDENPGLAEAFMKEQKLTFPVLLASSYVQDALHGVGVPQNWVVDAKGVVRLKGIGYDATEKWEEGMVEAVEKNKPEAATTAATSPPAL
jgi:hypothetical protein